MPGTRPGTTTAEQAEIARLRRELDRTTKRLATTEAALDIMGKAHALLESLSESADTPACQGELSPTVHSNPACRARYGSTLR